MANVEAKEIIPVVEKIDRTIREDWDFWKSVETVKGLYISWKNITEEFLHELWVAKTVIVGSRTSGLPKKGQLSWEKYVNATGLCKKSVDSHLKRYCENGFKKPEKLTVETIEDENIFRVHSCIKITDKTATLNYELNNDGVIRNRPIAI